MSKHFAIGMAVAVLCLVLAGCGGGSDGVSQSAHSQLQAELDALKAQQAEEAEEAKTETTAEEAADKKREKQIADLAAAIAALTTALAEDETTTTDTTTETDDEEEEEETDTTATTTPTTTPTTPTTTPTTPTTQSAEATQRAKNLQTALDAVTVDPLPASPVTMTVPTSGSLRLMHGSSTATLSGNGIRSATMTLTGTGDTGKTVVYTDRETSRAVLDHFDNRRNETVMTRFDLTENDIALGTGGAIDHVATPPVDTKWRIAHGVPASVGAVDGNTVDNDPADSETTLLDDLPATAENPKRANSYTGYLYGQSGTFVCSPVAGTTCQVQIAPNYATIPTNQRFGLVSVAVTSVTRQADGTFPAGGTLHFKPSSGARFQLYTGGPVGADDQYMVFGYWREDPASAAGVYQYEVFAQALPEATTFSLPTGITTVYYDGTAVGAYVEKDPSAAVDTYRQGEFIADVSLEATSATAVSGTIDDFKATPTGGSSAPKTADRWVLTLINGGTVHLNLAGGGTVADTDTQGAWKHGFVSLHTNAAANTPPPAVVGAFDAGIPNSVTIVGAFGAEKR